MQTPGKRQVKIMKDNDVLTNLVVAISVVIIAAMAMRGT
jgi:hypothetical protein